MSKIFHVKLFKALEIFTAPFEYFRILPTLDVSM